MKQIKSQQANLSTEEIINHSYRINNGKHIDPIILLDYLEIIKPSRNNISNQNTYTIQKLDEIRSTVLNTHINIINKSKKPETKVVKCNGFIIAATINQSKGTN